MACLWSYLIIVFNCQQMRFYELFQLHTCFVNTQLIIRLAFANWWTFGNYGNKFSQPQTLCHVFFSWKLNAQKLLLVTNQKIDMIPIILHFFEEQISSEKSVRILDSDYQNIEKVFLQWMHSYLHQSHFTCLQSSRKKFCK